MANCFGPPEANRQSSSGYGLPVAAALAHPVGDLLGHAPDLRAELGDVFADLLEDRAEALGVELERLACLLAHVGLLVAGAVLAAHDPVVFALLDPLHHLGDAPDGVGVGLADLVEEAADAV